MINIFLLRCYICRYIVKKFFFWFFLIFKFFWFTTIKNSIFGYFHLFENFLVYNNEKLYFWVFFHILKLFWFTTMKNSIFGEFSLFQKILVYFSTLKIFLLFLQHKLFKHSLAVFFFFGIFHVIQFLQRLMQYLR